VSQSFVTPGEFRRAAEQVNEYHRFQTLSRELTAINEQICQLRPAEKTDAGWTEAEKKRLLQFIKRSHGKSRRFSR
jgi:hypothetical protein